MNTITRMNTESGSETDFNLTENYAWVDELLEARYAYEEDSDSEELIADIYCCHRCDSEFLSRNAVTEHQEICFTMPLEYAKRMARRPQHIERDRRFEISDLDTYEYQETEDFDDELFERKRRPKYDISEYEEVIPMEIVKEHYLADVSRQLFPNDDEDEDEDDLLSVMSDIEVFPVDEDEFEQEIPLLKMPNSEDAMEIDFD